MTHYLGKLYDAWVLVLLTAFILWAGTGFHKTTKVQGVEVFKGWGQ